MKMENSKEFVETRQQLLEIFLDKILSDLQNDSKFNKTKYVKGFLKNVNGFRT